MICANRTGIFFSWLFLTALPTFSNIPLAHAEDEPFARIKAIGSVTLDGNTIREEDVAKDGAEIKTEKDSYANIELRSSKSHLTVNPNSTLILRRPKKNGEEAQLLKEGTVRAKVQHRSERNFKMQTPIAVFGVRGTEFIATSNPLFNEAEVIVLQGSIEVTSSRDHMDSKLIQAGEWSGIGGRYGKKVADPLKLSDTALKTLDKQSSAPEWTSFSTPNGSPSLIPKTSNGSQSNSGSHKAD
jgi:hypothetical protein